MPLAEKSFLIFDVWSDFACFKKNYATSSPQTFPFPPPSAILGLCGCIVGYRWIDFVNKYLREIEIGIEPQFYEQHGDGFSSFGYSKIRMGMKLIITKDVWNQKVFRGEKPFVSSPVPFELLYNPRYRIYIHSDNLKEKLGKMLREHKSYYTPYLGMAQFIANFRYVGEFQFEQKNEGGIFVNSVFVPLPEDEWSLSNNSKALYSQERYPLLRPTNSTDPKQPERDVQGYVDGVVPLSKSPIKISKGKYFEGVVNGVRTCFATVPV